MSTLEEFLALPDAPVVGAPPPTTGGIWPFNIQHLSASAIGMFRRCPEQFRHRYILGEKERPGEALVIGSAFHAGLEHNYVQKIESHEDRPVDELVQYLQDEGIPKVLEEDGGAEEIAWDGGDQEKGVARLRKDSERMLVAYARTVVPRIQPVAVEERFEIEVPGVPVPLIGYIDTETDDERIIDCKTGKQSVSKLKPSWMLQATVYAAAKGKDVEYHSISRAATPKITTALESPDMVMRPSLAQAINVFRTTKMIADTIAHYYGTYGPDETWPTFGRFADWSMSFSPCTNCGWRSVCPAMEGEI